MSDCALCNVILEVADQPGVEFLIEEEHGAVLIMGDTFVKTGVFPDYDGPCEVTPGPEEQILETRNTSVRADIVVGPIPQNYGLITYHANIITVS